MPKTVKKRPAGRRSNIIKCLDAADSVDISEGRVSYWRYHEVLQGMAAFWKVDFEKCVAVFAALSPNIDYTGNLRSLASVLKGWTEGVDVNFVRVSGYNHCRDRAYQYLSGLDFLSSVKGPKIRSFYSNILNPGDPGPVTIDGHAVNVWRGKPEVLKGVVGGFNYNVVVDDYRSVAREVGLLPNQVQSITCMETNSQYRLCRAATNTIRRQFGGPLANFAGSVDYYAFSIFRRTVVFFT